MVRAGAQAFVAALLCNGTEEQQAVKMCFDQRTSFMFAGVAFLGTFVIHKTTGNRALSLCIFYFFLMEFLQGFQYFWINDCDSSINQYLTMLGYLHICFQPFFSNLYVSLSATLCQSLPLHTSL